MALADQLRKAIERSSLTLYAVAKGSGLAYAVVHYFARGERTLTIDSAGKIADFLGLELAPKQSKKAKKGG
ncbi:MAG: helix-turn-helix transcriptional regulator [Thermoguttaceae bacterium]